MAITRCIRVVWPVPHGRKTQAATGQWYGATATIALTVMESPVVPREGRTRDTCCVHHSGPPFALERSKRQRSQGQTVGRVSLLISALSEVYDGLAGYDLPGMILQFSVHGACYRSTRVILWMRSDTDRLSLLSICLWLPYKFL